jgi:hypothetical protein
MEYINPYRTKPVELLIVAFLCNKTVGKEFWVLRLGQVRLRRAARSILFLWTNTSIKEGKE